MNSYTNRVKYLLKQILPWSLRSKLKRQKRKTVNGLKKKQIPISLAQMGAILETELGICKGDKLIVASSFGNLNADFSPKELIELLQKIVTGEGIIMMPYYPPKNSSEFAKSSDVFDMQETKSSMGILTNVFSKMDNVYKSKHPTKAVCVWGKNAELIVKGHDKAKTPFYWDSPYGKLQKMGSKSLGLGLKNIPIFHLEEDVLLENKESYYYPDKYSLTVIDNGTIENVETFVHSAEIISKLKDAGDYVRNLKCKTYRQFNVGFAFCYVIDNTELFEVCSVEFMKGHTRA